MSGKVSFNKELQSSSSIISGKASLPTALTLSGTFVSNGKGVRGTSTKFTTELDRGKYLYNGTELREIDYIISDTFLYLKDAFSTDVETGIAVKTPSGNRYRKIYIKNTGAAAAIINGDSLATGKEKSIDSISGIAPISIDATGTSLQVEVFF